MELRESLLVAVVAPGLMVTGASCPAHAEENPPALSFMAVPTIFLRTADLGKLAEFYVALGLTVGRAKDRLYPLFLQNRFQFQKGN